MDTLREDHDFTRAKSAQAQNWYSFASGHSGVGYGANFTREGDARIELYIDRFDGQWNRRALESLYAVGETIESSLGSGPLDWQPLDGRRACRIATTRPGSIDDDDETLTEMREWMVKQLLTFRRVFDPYLRELAVRMEEDS